MKKLISVLICLSVVIACVIPGIAATPVTAKVFNIYQNNMLFEQNETNIVAGTAKNGSEISCFLYNKAHNLITSSETVSENGEFSVSFEAPKGSFDEYTLVLKENGMTFKTLTGILFGELWLASGQSNMELYMNLCSTWDEFKSNGYGSKWVRVLTLVPTPHYEGSETTVPLTPQNDVPGAVWARACDANIERASAVAVYFAHKLMSEINMPVGIINSSFSGSRIETWLSRENIESDNYALSIAHKYGSYWTEDTWVNHSFDDNDGNFIDYTSYMSVNYNGRLSPMKNFRISGMIWYQGEANMGSETEEYTYLLNMLQQQNTELFSYSKGKLPIIYSQLAAYDYNINKSMHYFNFALSEFQKEDPESRACISIYDLPLTFSENYHTIHPLDKKPIGERMAENAAVMVYGKEGVYSAPTFTSAKIRDCAVYVTLDNVGDGIIAVGGNVKGFALCGEDGVYYRAEAKITGQNTVKVYSESVEFPVCVTYAYSNQNDRANLYSSYHATVGIPLTPFISNLRYNNINASYNSDWADCETEELWNIAYTADRSSDTQSGYYNVWDTVFCSKKIVSLDQYKFDKALNLRSISRYFSLEHKFTSKKLGKDEVFFTNQDRNWSKYGALGFLVRNNGNKDIIVNNKIVTAETWYSATINGSVNDKYVIPADGQWHKVELNFSVLCNKGNKSQPVDSSALKDVRSFEIFFNSKGLYSNLDVDEFNFAPTATENNNTQNDNKSLFDFYFEIINKIFALIF